ncbi:class I SAM-dependent methyltransferase [Gayadomonas joobiniege]|uniref:class I SAM-dependent methyltransferase n=1 Tax=Gayadomonas joobiniege TaxID=1234606 RepID=UPI000361324A|nr:class I SAM-dependent methyltransferase [Gayadomonas joobiniege]
MKITVANKLSVFLTAISMSRGFKTIRAQLRHAIRPIEAVRTLEISYMLKWLNLNPDFKPKLILDVSSPYVAAQCLDKKANAEIIKTDINIQEMYIIDTLKTGNIRFKKEDATKLSFPDNHFDFVYSISVIEHIYQKYLSAIEEMIRVTRPGGYIYLTTHTAPELMEEWVEQKIYSHQARNKDKTFFQYRFNTKDILHEIEKVSNVTIESIDLYPESYPGAYDRLVRLLKSDLRNNLLNRLKKFCLDFYFGLFLFKKVPCKNELHTETKIANLHIVLKKSL